MATTASKDSTAAMACAGVLLLGILFLMAIVVGLCRRRGRMCQYGASIRAPLMRLEYLKVLDEQTYEK